MRHAALILVNFRSSSLAIDAIRSARAATSRSLHVVVVDNSVDAGEAEALRLHADVLVIADRNLGYAAAINRGRRETDAQHLIVSNPDVVFERGSIDRLLESGASVTGPALFWDDRFEWILPPAELHLRAAVLDRALASRWRAWARGRDRRRIEERLAFWSLEKPTPVRALSGAVLAIRTDAFDEAGGFDERFRLYFEENDFLRRVRGDVVYLPSARCRHLYNQSAASSPEAEALFAASERAYVRKWNGPAFTNIVGRIQRPLATSPATRVTDESVAVPEGCWIEASPLASFDTAAGRKPGSAAAAIPASIWNAYRADTLYFRVVQPVGPEVIATYARHKIRA